MNRPLAVSLAGQREDGVRPALDAAADHAGEVHAEEGERGVGDRIDEPPHEPLRLGRELEVLAAERKDAQVEVSHGHARDPVGLQPRARDDPAGRDRSAGGPHDRAVAALLDRPDLRSEADLASRPGDAFRESPAHRAIVDDARLRDVQSGEARAVLLVVADARRPEPAHAVQPVGRRAVAEPLEPRQFVGRRRHHHLAGHAVRDRLAPAEVEQPLVAVAAQGRLQRPGRVVQARVDDAAVAPRLVQGDVPLLLEDQDRRARTLLEERPCDGEADDAPADDDRVDGGRRGHGISTG